MVQNAGSNNTASRDQELYESCGGRPGLPSLTVIVRTVSVDVKQR